MKTDSKKRSVDEDAVMKNEDEGGAMMAGGDVQAPSASAPTMDVIQTTDAAKPAGGLTTTDVLGKCDHNKDGCFGPGCFHYPLPVFPVYSRLPKKKKRKYDNILTEDDDRSDFVQYATRVAKTKIIQANDELSKIDPNLHVIFDTKSDFEPNSQWIALYQPEEMISPNNIPVSFNMDYLYEMLYQEGLELDDVEIDIQITVSLWHEIAYGIIDYLVEHGMLSEPITGQDAEKTASEYGLFHAGKYTKVTRSKLQEILNKEYGLR